MSCLLLGGPDRKIGVGTAVVKFEDHPYCGPMPSKQLGPKHPFWPAVSLWYQQGKRIDDKGMCVWSNGRNSDGGASVGGFARQ